MPSPALPSPPVPSTPAPPAGPAFRRWAIAVTVYIAAVFNRTSLGVAGLEAASRFRITPGQLSVFVLAQLGVYAAMQVPTGLLVDRYGPRRLLITAACVMALAQLAFAVVRSYPGALLARGVLGCGDALAFVSVIRFAAQDFAPRPGPRRREEAVRAGSAARPRSPAAMSPASKFSSASCIPQRLVRPGSSAASASPGHHSSTAPKPARAARSTCSGRGRPAQSIERFAAKSQWHRS